MYENYEPETYCPMPKTRQNPNPKRLEVKILSRRTRGVKFRVGKRNHGVGILIQSIIHHTRPTCPKRVKQKRQPFNEVNLPRKPIVEGEKELSENHGTIFIEIITNKPRDPFVPPSPMNQK